MGLQALDVATYRVECTLWRMFDHTYISRKDHINCVRYERY